MSPTITATPRLIMYDELFRDWETVLKFQIGGRDAPDSSGEGEAGKKEVNLHDARRYMSASAPRTPLAHLIESALGLHLFVADGSRLFDVGAELFRRCGAAMARGDSDEIEDLLRQAGLDGPPMIDDAPLPPPKIRALSLAIAQKCNLGCAYCYAQQGDFGGAGEEHVVGGRALRRRVAGWRGGAGRAPQSRVPRRRAARQPADVCRRPPGARESLPKRAAGDRSTIRSPPTAHC